MSASIKHDFIPDCSEIEIFVYISNLNITKIQYQSLYIPVISIKTVKKKKHSNPAEMFTIHICNS